MFDFLTRDNKQLRAQIFEFLKAGAGGDGQQGPRVACMLQV